MILKQVILAVTILLSTSIYAQEIKFVDLNLKTALIGLGYDFNNNKEIEVSEIDTITTLNISEKNINRLDDLIHFKKLKSLNAMSNNITNLQVFFNNKVIQELYIGENKFGKKLVLKNLTNLKGLFAFKNNIEVLEIENSNNIELMSLQNNQLKDINLKKLSSLKSLDLSNNSNLNTLDISKNKKLEQLYLTLTSIKTLNVAKNKKLKTIYLEEKVELIKTKSQSHLKATPKIRSNN